MPGYEELTPDQILHIANIALAAAITIMLSRVIPAILEWRTVKSLEVQIITKQCGEEKQITSLTKILDRIKERKNKRDNQYIRRYD